MDADQAATLALLQSREPSRAFRVESRWAGEPSDGDGELG